MSISAVKPSSFYGWRVVAGAFVLAIFGWGLGFYGPPIYLQTVREARGWSIELVSAAVTTHYLFGAAVVANMPRLYRRFGLPGVMQCGSLALAIGLFGWAVADKPWQLFLASFLTGGGWVTMGAAAVNAVIAPWFIALRPKALSTAYNGASIGGVIFSPLWVLLIGQFGFAAATLVVSLPMLAVVWGLSATLFNRAPQDVGEVPDGGAGPVAAKRLSQHSPLPGRQLWRDRAFQTLAATMALSLFAQIGLLAHLFSLAVPVLGKTEAGLVAGLATASAIFGRTMFGWLIKPGTDRRLVAQASYAVQIAGLAILLVFGAETPAALVLAVLFFGFGVGNATSLPPLIAQSEFASVDVSRVVALIVAMAQSVYAFAPAVFGLIRAQGRHTFLFDLDEGRLVALTATIAMLLAIALLWVGRAAIERRPQG